MSIRIGDIAYIDGMPPFNVKTGQIHRHSLFEEKTPDDGIIRLEKYPEGYQLWYHGKIVWKSAT
jgi:hypothetical protein